MAAVSYTHLHPLGLFPSHPDAPRVVVTNHQHDGRRLPAAGGILDVYKRQVPEGHYTHAKARHTGNLWLRHAKRWRHFDAAASAGVSLTPYGLSLIHI